METVAMTLIVLVCLVFVLRLSFHGLWGTLALSGLVSVFVVITHSYATTQSKAVIAEWLQQPKLMLDVAVVVAFDVAFQIWFCFQELNNSAVEILGWKRLMRKICFFIPGVLIFPVMFAVMTELIFLLPGVDFATIGYGVAVVTIVAFPLFALVMRQFVPEMDLRLEMLFMINLIIGCMGVVATVNGRTAATGTYQVEWNGLIKVSALLFVGAVVGLIYDKILTKRNIKNNDNDF